MKQASILTLGAALTACMSGGATLMPAAAQSTVEISNIVGVVDVRYFDGETIEVEIEQGSAGGEAPEITRSGEDVRIKSPAKRWRNVSCSSRGGETRVSFNREAKHALSEYSRVSVRMPRGTALVASGGVVQGRVEGASSADLSLSGCGDWEIGDIAGDVKIKSGGSGDVEIGSVGGELTAQIAGSGDVSVGDVGSGADENEGSGVQLNVAGSGDVDIQSILGPLSVNSAGSGDLDVGALNGTLSVRLAGSGDVTIGAGEAPSVDAQILGSGDVLFGGAAGDVSGNILGSGDITVASATGKVKTRALGSGRVRVDDR